MSKGKKKQSERALDDFISEAQDILEALGRDLMQVDATPKGEAPRAPGRVPEAGPDEGPPAFGEKDKMTYAGVLRNQGVGLPPVHQG